MINWLIDRAPLGFLLLTTLLHSFVQSQSAADYMSVPPVLAGSGVNPLVVLNASNDHQQYHKAYDDYSDLNADGNLDTSFDNSIRYEGYFDPELCYEYSAGVFQPSSDVDANDQCPNGFLTGYWSGNFLNWATMTRMDLIRQALYGGKRSTDINGSTVLERALLPDDGHAFVKMYQGADIDLYTPYSTASISLCNVTVSPGGGGVVNSGSVSTSANPPVFHVAEGLFPRWASANARSCTWNNAGVDRPRDVNVCAGAIILGVCFGTILPNQQLDEDINVRVQACVTGHDGDKSSRCRSYSNGNKKPFGVLQQYGENKQLRFGLFEGSYQKNAEGGVIRRNVDYLVGNSDVSKNEIDTDSGIFLNTTGNGIIAAYNRKRISRYDYVAGVYSDCSDATITASEFKSAQTGISSRDCADWGGPLSETYAEILRYFSGAASATSAFSSLDTGHIPTLASPAWEDPITSADSCASCAVVNIQLGGASYDIDDSVSGITGVTSAATETNTIASEEGLSGQYLIGETPTDANGVCDSKSVSNSNFGSVKGECLSAPSAEAGYQIAGLALHAKTNDLRVDRDLDQHVDTHTIAYGTAIPVFSIDIAGSVVEFSPRCQKTVSAQVYPCQFIDAQIQTSFTASSGSVQIVWDAASYGDDYEMDAVQQIDYCVGSACGGGVGSNQIQFSQDLERKTEAVDMQFGYAISGVSGDGTYMNYSADAAENPGQLSDAPLAVTDAALTINANASPDILETPLWYAAKYGGFEDSDGSNTPNLVSEWDAYTSDGSLGADGIPDQHFPIVNPSELYSSLSLSLDRVLASVTEVVAASSTDVYASVSQAGRNAFYSAYYYPQFDTFSGSVLEDSVTWVGNLRGLFLDSEGNLREDSTSAGTRGTLDDKNTDYVVELVFDSGAGETVVRRYDASGTQVGADDSYENLQALWNARDVLADIDDVVSQRDYEDDAGDGRYIFTWIDKDGDQRVDQSVVASTNEVLALTADSFPAASASPAPSEENNFRYLGISDSELADDIVNYVRGEEQTGARSRSTDYDDDGDREVWRLGDIVHSRPAVVAAPNQQWGISIGDETYQAYAQFYRERREVIYVGGNDGLLHAFNGGVWNQEYKRFEPQGHTLGAELWAYAPMNVLPHLQWLRDPSYPHVYFVDGEVQAFDVNIFDDDDTHPNGWGTILVVGMRLGGGDFAVDTNGDGSDDTQLRSAYVVLDVTDPEQPPVLLAELSDSDLGFTTGFPTVVKRRKGLNGAYANPAQNQWLLVFGSGPTSISTVTSNQDSKLYAYDLSAGDWLSPSAALQSAVGEATSFVGGIVAVDSDDDFVDDVLYFGTVGGSEASPTGLIKRVLLADSDNLGLSSTASASNLSNIAKPVPLRPIVHYENREMDRWLSFATGRSFTLEDMGNTAAQSYYGIREPETGGSFNYSTYNPANAIDVTNITVHSDGSVSNAGADLYIGIEQVETFTELRSIVRDAGAWRRDFDTPLGEGAERVLSSAELFNNHLFFTTFQPDSQACQLDGEAALFAISPFVGLPFPYGPLGEDTTTPGGSSAYTQISLGSLIPQSPLLHDTPASLPQLLIPGGDGQIVRINNGVESSPMTRGRRSWREIKFDDSLLD